VGNGSEPLYYVTVSRVFLITGAAVYIRGAVNECLGEWATPAQITVGAPDRADVAVNG